MFPPAVGEKGPELRMRATHAGLKLHITDGVGEMSRLLLRLAAIGIRHGEGRLAQNDGAFAEHRRFLQLSTRNKAMKSEAAPEPRALLRLAAEAYGRALAMVGGEERGSRMRQGAQTAVCAAVYASPPFDLRVPSLPVPRLFVNLTRALVTCGVEGEPPRSYEALRDLAFLVPAGVPTRWRKDSPGRHLNIFFLPNALGVSDATDAILEKEHVVFNLRAAGIRQLADQLVEELGNSCMLNAEAAECLARLMLVRFARRLDEGTATSPLTPVILQRITGFVMANLTRRILVAEMALEVGLSPNRFAQAFSECTRQSPHQFVIALRLDRAAKLLRDSNLNLALVAHDCGFANQQHLCNSMRRVLGTTPSSYRRAHKQGPSS
jgi:AraC family transcriptional regulator